jgi:O-antigen ligase
MHVSSESLLNVPRQLADWPPRRVVELTTAAAIALALGYVILGGDPRILAMLVGAPLVLALAVASPEVIILLILGMVLGVLPPAANPYLRLAGKGLYPSDLLILSLLGVVGLRLLADRKFRFVHTPMDVPMLLLLGAVLIAVFTAITAHGITFSNTTYEARILLYYVLFFAVTNLIRTPAQLDRLIVGVTIIAILAALLMLAQSFAGYSFSLRGQELMQDAGVVRVFHPGTIAILAIMMVQLSGLGLREGRDPALGDILMLLILSLSLLVTLGRNLLISSSIALLLLIVLIFRSHLPRFLARGFMVAIAIAGLVGLLVLSGHGAPVLRYLGAFQERLSQLDSGGALSASGPLNWRWREIQSAWARLQDSPFFGIGVATAYRLPFYPGDPLTHYLHNAYLSLWLKTGVLGLIAFLWLCFRFLQRGFARWSLPQDPARRATVLGFTLAFFATMISNLVAPFFVQDWGLALFAVMFGINEVIFAQSKIGQEQGTGV